MVSTSSLLIAILASLFVEQMYSKECYGTSNGLSYIRGQGDLPFISTLKKRFVNCTKVIGNLEITHLTDQILTEAKMDSFDFLSEIREVTGYVLIFGLSLKGRSITIPNLQVIHGKSALYLHRHYNEKRLREFALFIASNDLENINLPNLLSVGGGLGLISNKRLCYWQTVNFEQWLGKDYGSKLLIEKNYDLCNDADVACEKCDHCFGPTSQDCQKIFYTNCSKTCNSALCLEEKGSVTCCHEQCKFGCTGSSVKECLYCKHYSHKGLCVENCPAQYHGYNGQCVRFCPDNTINHKGECVLECPSGYYESFLKTCKKCEDSCLKSETCIINEPITSRNIKKFHNCRKVQGFLTITDDTFRGGVGFTEDHQIFKKRPLKYEDLEILANVEVVTEYVMIQIMSENIRDLKFLRNLRQIEGRRFAPIGETFSLLIVNSPNLMDLDLPALKQVTSGNVMIQENGDACVVDLQRWSTIAPKRLQMRHDPLCDEARTEKQLKQ